MIPFEEIALSDEIRSRLLVLARQVVAFREEGPLDPVSLAKLEEHFKASHIYHSAGIEGNRLTLQETALVLKEGLEISDKPLKDSVEVKSLGEAFEFIKVLSDHKQTLRETDVRALHKLIVGHDDSVSPGEYRKIGVVISGAEHRPPEPIDVPIRMEQLLAWVNLNIGQDPVIVGAVAHHELVAIHPFKDGNGRVSRLLMNLILLRSGYPICNIRRDKRPQYYESLAFADVGIYEAIVDIVRTQSEELFGEYLRVREETRRMEEWAQRWGAKEAEVLHRRESRELELWLSRIRQVFLEFQKAADLIDETLARVEIVFYDYKTEISFDRYQQLLRDGQTPLANAFSITFEDRSNRRQERFMFRYFRNWDKFPYPSKVIPLELNYKSPTGYVRMCDLDWAQRIRLRELYFSPEGELVIRYFNVDKGHETEKRGGTVVEAVQWFFDDILRNVFMIT